jgi:hypothetical protein
VPVKQLIFRIPFLKWRQRLWNCKTSRNNLFSIPVFNRDFYFSFTSLRFFARPSTTFDSCKTRQVFLQDCKFFCKFFCKFCPRSSFTEFNWFSRCVISVKWPTSAHCEWCY